MRRNLFRACRDHAQFHYNYFLDTLRFKQGTGILAVEDLALINSWLHEHNG